MSLQESIRAVLEADESFATWLSGGIYTGIEITRQSMPQAFDVNGEILPCALIKASTTTQNGPYLDSARTIVQIYFYQFAGTDILKESMDRAIILLNGTRPGNAVWEMRFADQVEDAIDPGLNCSLGVARFGVMRRMVPDQEDAGSGS